MISINLLPQDIGSKASKGPTGGPSQGALLVTLLLIVLYAGIIGAGSYFYLGAQEIAQKKKDNDTKLASLKKEVESEKANYQELRDDLDVLRGQVALLEVLDPEDRLYWAEKINLIPQVIPDGVFLTKVDVIETVKQKETQASKKAQADYEKIPKKDREKDGIKRPRKSFYPEIVYEVTFDGISYVEDGTDDQLLEKIIEFHNSMKNDPVVLPFNGEKTSYMNRLNNRIEIPYAQGREMGDRNVFEFTFFMKSEPYVPIARDDDKNKSKGAAS